MLRAKRELFLVEFEREFMRKAGLFNAQLMDHLRPHIKAGVTTGEIDQIAHEYTLEHNHRPACLGYQGFPKSICTSVNEVVCHGIPNETPLKSGDIINVDITTNAPGNYGPFVDLERTTVDAVQVGEIQAVND